MAEAVALFASVITIAALVKESVRRVRTFLRASEELVALQEQVEDFAVLVRDIKDQHASTAPQTITTALFRATQTLRHLHSLMKTKVLREQNITARALRRAWARNRTNIFRLQDVLKENRLSLLAAMSASSLYSSSRSATTALDQDQRLVDIQQTVLSTHHAVVSQATAVSHLLQSISGGYWSQHLEQANYSHQPASQLELSGTFFPETYTVNERLPRSCLFILRSHQTCSFGDFKINQYNLLLMKSPRQWYRLTASVKIHRSSVYWASTEIASEDCVTSSPSYLAKNATLPYTLQPKMQAFLAAKVSMDDAHFSLSLSDGYGDQSNPWELHSQADCASPRVPCDSLGAWGFIDDLGCPRIPDSEVTQVELLEAPNRFLSCLRGKMVVEIRFVNAIPCSEALYNIRVLHCMRDHDHFARLVGVLVDNEKRQLKSFLFGYPGQSRTLEQRLWTEGIPWHLRQKWARQLVEGVHQLHSKGFVAGTLFSAKSPVLIDATQNIEFWWLKNKFKPGRPRETYGTRIALV
ncbi:MAG: hypothetical protein Q9208_004190 [Pyrenodesmia sp. 3 TL-2023]